MIYDLDIIVILRDDWFDMTHGFIWHMILYYVFVYGGRKLNERWVIIDDDDDDDDDDDGWW